MQQLVAEGLVDNIGVAGGPVDLLRKFVATGAFEVVLTYNRWTLLHRSAEPIRLATHPVPDELWTVLADLTPAEENWLR
ncbi:MAG: D-threo-aldose 1-dehydrogenase [Pseudonocardia sp.]|jgi:aryl-alcohol dehydrogenase-like predicted oxidoreductase